MWIKLDLTPLFVNGLLIGLLVLGAGVAIRLSYPKRASIGTFIIVLGAIPVLVCLVALVGDPIADWLDKWQNRTTIEQLAKDREIQGIRWPRGTKVEWYGKLMSGATLAQPQPVLGIPLEGAMKFSITFTNNRFHLATDLETGILATDHLIDGVPCKAHHEVEFFHARGPDPEDGRVPKARVGMLKRCTPSAAFDFAGNRYLADTEVTLNGFDGIGRGVLAVDQDVDGHWCKQGTQVERPEKRAIRFTLARDEMVSGIACKAGEEVVIEPEKGHVTSAVLAHDQDIGGIPCRGGEAVGFEYGDGSYPLDSCVIRLPVTVLDVVWPSGTSLKALSRGWLQATLPRGSGGVVIGEVKIVGRCKISLTKTPLTIDNLESLDEKAAYAELRGARFTQMNFYQGSGWGELAEPAIIDGVAYEAGASIRINTGSAK
jgi:hypothetical protein